MRKPFPARALPVAVGVLLTVALGDLVAATSATAAVNAGTCNSPGALHAVLRLQPTSQTALPMRAHVGSKIFVETVPVSGTTASEISASNGRVLHRTCSIVSAGKATAQFTVGAPGVATLNAHTISCQGCVSFVLSRSVSATPVHRSRTRT